MGWVWPWLVWCLDWMPPKRTTEVFRLVIWIPCISLRVSVVYMHYWFQISICVYLVTSKQNLNCFDVTLATMMNRWYGGSCALVYTSTTNQGVANLIAIQSGDENTHNMMLIVDVGQVSQKMVKPDRFRCLCCVWTINEPHLPDKRPRCYAKSPGYFKWVDQEHGNLKMCIFGQPRNLAGFVCILCM